MDRKDERFLLSNRQGGARATKIAEAWHKCWHFAHRDVCTNFFLLLSQHMNVWQTGVSRPKFSPWNLQSIWIRVSYVKRYIHTCWAVYGNSDPLRRVLFDRIKELTGIKLPEIGFIYVWRKYIEDSTFALAVRSLHNVTPVCQILDRCLSVFRHRTLFRLDSLKRSNFPRVLSWPFGVNEAFEEFPGFGLGKFRDPIEKLSDSDVSNPVTVHV